MALDNLGPDAQAALPVLQKSLRDGNWFVRTHAAAAFVRLAARDKAMLPVLLQAVMNPLQETDVPLPWKMTLVAAGIRRSLPSSPSTPWPP